MHIFKQIAVQVLAEAVLNAIPEGTEDPDGQAARFDMQAAHDDPAAWFADLGTEAAEWALEKAVEATAEYTCNGWEDDTCRAAFEFLFPTE